MVFSHLLFTPGEHSLTLDGLVGPLEVVITIPEKATGTYIAILGHPHSLQGGTMNNKVVTTLVRVMKELGIPSLRFNFRGVGQTAGVFDDGIGESEDMLALASLWQQEQPQSQFIFAGFSFGSYVAYRAAARQNHALLITIAPPVHHYDYTAFNPAPTPWLIVQGEDDEVVPCAAVMDFAQHAEPTVPIIYFAHTGHFFHGQLVTLKATLLEWITTQLQR